MFLQHKISDKIVEIIREFLEQYHISVYDEKFIKDLYAIY